MVKSANNALARAKSTLWVDSARFSPRGITCATANIPTTSDLDIIEATLSGRLLRARVCILASRSFIKIVDVPFFKPGMTEPIPSAEVGAQLQRSIIPSDYVAEFATVWIDLSDSQRGTCTSQLIGRCLFLNEAEVLIKGVKAHTGTPQCQCCWHWGHNTEGVAEVTPRSPPPSHPLQRMRLARMSALASIVATNMLQTITAARTGGTASTGLGSETGPSGTHRPTKAFPLPPPTPRDNKIPPRDRTLRPPHQGTPQPSLPPIHEDDEGDDDDMAPFGLALDNDYDFHE
ncbi:hypothetical protein P691DRAFT_761136 [Macrolepiota fuliginosa MF-IS2]|uniref:Uncharacterized protein n=1 Tax=Macrolepiota fuliginosa MF-IS2 TaxID=1400762 RepID=A0A9P6C378_9AGAR|nr:hypothetical protein P691DRAFT_761136 [Macrolepiota fuliginosa MF-IS2]